MCVCVFAFEIRMALIKKHGRNHFFLSSSSSSLSYRSIGHEIESEKFGTFYGFLAGHVKRAPYTHHKEMHRTS